jgi:stage V sporulation protein AE
LSAVWPFVIAFAVGGGLCALAQLAMGALRLSAAHVMVGFVVLGAAAGFCGLYGPLVKVAQAGATVPLSGFGFSLYQGAVEDAHRLGWVGAFSGGLRATGAGIKAAVVFSLAAALFVRPRR